MKKPCDRCPFRKDSMRGFLADYTPEILHRIVMSEQYFPCHKTLPNVESLTPKESEKYPKCIGALMYMKKGCKIHSDNEIQNELNNYTKEELEIVLSIPEFFNHHKPFIK